MARNGYPDDPNDYSGGDPTQYANYGGSGGQAYSEAHPPEPAPYSPESGYIAVPPTGYSPAPVPPPPPAWHHRPAVLVGLGVLTAAVLALLVYAIVKFVGATDSKPDTKPASTSTSSSISAAPTTSSEAPSTTTQTVAPPPSTTTVTPTTSAAPTTTVAPSTTTETPTPSTTTTISTSVTTVTETTTKPLWPTLPRPTWKPAPTLMEPPAGQ